REPREEALRLLGLEVADGAAQEDDQAALAGGDAIEVAIVVADHPVDPEPGIGGEEPRPARAQHPLADVEGDIAAAEADRGGGVEEHAGLAGRAAAQLDQVAGAEPPEQR